MPASASIHRPILLHTPLGDDALMLTAMRGREGISRLYSFRVEMVSESRKDFDFDKLLGKQVGLTVLLPGRKKRHLSGICKSLSQGERDTTFVNYEMEIVPRVWFLTKRVRSRIFQHIGVPDILKKVFAGYDVSFEIQGNFEPRDYCVQYRESDFDFASRLMEEEGIHYFFKHSADGHKMIVANSPASHPELPHYPTLRYDAVNGGSRPDARVATWRKTQEVRSARVTLWDHCFELPEMNLEASAPIAESVAVGSVVHSQSALNNRELEIYDYPGGYAQRFDGINRGGGEQPDELEKIFRDKDRTAKIRMQEEAACGVRIQGSGNLRQLSSGHKFTLEGHFNANGPYLVTDVDHIVRLDDTRSSGDEYHYATVFQCVPFAQPYRPARTTARPTIRGSQTATVVGPKGEEIFTDKYGRVKVQFPWDREGKFDAESSCWIRVSTTWADRGFGFVQIPRIGQEVIVDFLEGDPDRPIVTGCVFNGKNPPPFALPEKKMVSGFKSNSYPGGGGNNEITLDDSKGAERMFLNAQFNQDTVVGNNRTAKVAVDSAEEVGNNVAETVGNNKTVSVGVNETTTVGTNQTTSVGANIVINAGTSITLQCGASRIHMNQAGFITITGTVITVGAAANLAMAAPLTEVVGGVMLSAVGGVTLVEGGVTHIGGGKLVSVTSGGQVDVVASADLVCKGATIKLNG